MLKNYLSKKIINPILAFLKKGTSPKKLSLTLSLGIIFGIMPFMGVGTYLLILVAILLKLNIPIIQLINQTAVVIKLVLFVPFLKIGQIIFKAPDIPFALKDILSNLRFHFWETFSVVWKVSLSGIAVWMIISIPLGYILYRISLFYFISRQNKLQYNTGFTESIQITIAQYNNN